MTILAVALGILGIACSIIVCSARAIASFRARPSYPRSSNLYDKYGDQGGYGYGDHGGYGYHPYGYHGG